VQTRLGAGIECLQQIGSTATGKNCVEGALKQATLRLNFRQTIICAKAHAPVIQRKDKFVPRKANI